MPIGDLLASISGGEPPDRTAPKRKAEDSPGNVVKVPRNTTSRPSASSSRHDAPARPSQQASSMSRPLGTNGSKPVPMVSRPASSATNRVTKPSPLTRPVPNDSSKQSASLPAVPKAAPKKGSFAEIMARAQKAQQTQVQVGKIQHKKVEKGAIKRDRVPVKPSSQAKTGRPSGYSGTSKALPRGENGASLGSASRDGRAKPTSGSGKPSANGSKRTLEEPQKKIKKAALATTGYTGTSRARPGSSTKKDNNARGGALLNHAPQRPSGSSRSRYDSYENDYDEDLDDFIEYDDDEDDGLGPRYDYASDGSSDMEAGMDELDIEERRAETIARREDIEEERRERDHKAAKEARKRAALEALRAKRS